MQTIKACRRVVIGRNITLTAAIIYSLSRCVYYATLNPGVGTQAQELLTGDGRLLGLWATVWAIAAGLCVVDMVNRHTRWGLSLVVGLAFGWGLAYGTIFAINGLDDTILIYSAISWIALAAIIFGLLLKVTALQDMVRQKPPGVPVVD